MAKQLQVDIEKPPKPVFSTPSSSSSSSSKSSSSNESPPTAKKLSFSIVVISVIPLLYLSLLHSSPSSVFNDTKFWFLMSNAIIFIVAADSGMFAGAFRDEPADVYQEYYWVKLDRLKNTGSGVPRGDDKPAPRIQWMKKDPNASLTVTQLVSSQGSSNIPQKEEQKKTKASLGRLLPSQAAILQKEKHMSEEWRSRSAPELAGAPSDDSVVVIKEVLAVSATEKKGRLSSSSSEEEEEDSDYAAMSDVELNRRVEEFIRMFNQEIRQQEGDW